MNIKGVNSMTFTHNIVFAKPLVAKTLDGGIPLQKNCFDTCDISAINEPMISI